MRKFFVLVTSILYLLQEGTTVRAQSPTILNPPAGPVTATYFGMHNHEPLIASRLISIDIGTYRLWDASVNWPNLEPSRGKWVFDRLDGIVKLAEQQHWQVIVPFAFSPAWASARPTEDAFHTPDRLGWSAEPRNLDDWREYVRTVATRYKGRVHIYEIWNEPNNHDNFTGSIPQMVTLTQEAYSIVKSIDPGATIVSPSVAHNSGTGLQYLDTLFAQGIAKFADVIGYHFYIDNEPPERLPVHIAEVRQIMTSHGAENKPLWNTEASWAAAWIRFPSAVRQAAWVARSYILNWAAGVKQYDWYAWDNRVYPSIYMVEADLHTPTAAAGAYSQVRAWLLGSRMTTAAQDTSGFWVSTLIRPDGTFAYIVWNPNRTALFTIPSAWDATRVQDLAGRTQTISSSQLSIGESPVLFETEIPAAATERATAVSAASLALGPVAPDSLVSIFTAGLNAGPESISYLPLFPTLGDATVLIRDSTGQDLLAPLLYAGSGQVNFALPGGTSVGPATVIAMGRDRTIFRTTLEVAAVAPGIFTASSSGSGPPAAYTTLTHPGGAQTFRYTFQCSQSGCQNASIPATNSSAKSTLVLFTTGLRNAGPTGIRASLCGYTVPVILATTSAYPGTEQLNIDLPATLAGCGSTTLTVSTQGSVSNAVTLAIE